MKKSIFIILGIFIFSAGIGQKITISNDSINLIVSPQIDSNGCIYSFSFNLTNNSNKKFMIGFEDNGKPSCFIYKIGNDLLVYFGGTVPALYDYTPEWVQLSEIKNKENVKLERLIGSPYASNIVINKEEYKKMRKLIVLDYLPDRHSAFWLGEKYKYSEFLKNKLRLYLEINP